MEIAEILSHCDHTLLRPGCTGEEIRALCDEALRRGVASVCIPPCHVAGAKSYLGDRMKICTVIGFPHGSSTPTVKAFEAQEAIRDGADEIDMVVNLSMVKDACWDGVAEELRRVRAFTQGHVLKVIIETCLLTEEEKKILCELVSASGAEYIKTSTGFSDGGATAEDVALLRECSAPGLKVKAAGGISSLEDAERFLALGADRLGTSRLVRLADEAEAAAAAEAEALASSEAAQTESEPAASDSMPEADASTVEPLPEPAPTEEKGFFARIFKK